MNGPYYSGLEVDPRYVNGRLIRHVHLMSPHHELETSGLQVVGFAQSEIVLPNDTGHRIYKHRKSEIELSKDTGHRICGHRKTTFWLSLALVAFVALGVTGISIAGFLATKWKSEKKEKSNLQANLSSTSNLMAVISSSVLRASSGRDSPTSVVAVLTATSTSPIVNKDSTATMRSATGKRTANSTYTTADSTYRPVTSASPTNVSSIFISSNPDYCPSLESPYTPPAVINSGQFDLACQTDFDLPHFQELTTNSFIECITECARHNLSQMVLLQGRCAVASFMASGYEGITCWLKSSNSSIQGRTTEKVSSAVARTGKTR